LFRTLAEVLNLGVDFVDEDELLLPTSLAKFKVLYVTEPDLPLAGGAALVAWVKSGGTLITVAGAGQFDEYDEPTAVFQTELFGSPEAGEETVYFLSVFYMETIILPRQARDKHRESAQKRERRFRFLAAKARDIAGPALIENGSMVSPLPASFGNNHTRCM
jgi:hypothetical protein